MFEENDKPLAYYFFEYRNLLKLLKQELDQYKQYLKKVWIICIGQHQNLLNKSWYHK